MILILMTLKFFLKLVSMNKMASGFKVFLISPLRVVIYSFSGDDSISYIYNAGSLEPIRNPKIDSFKEITGVVTTRFGVNPVIVGYDDDSFEILYSPPRSGILLQSDGSAANSRGRKVTVISSILIPDLSRSYIGSSIRSVDLDDPDVSLIQNYIDQSQMSQPMSPEPSNQMLAQPISVPVGVNSIDSPVYSNDSPRDTIKSPTPKLVIIKPEQINIEQEEIKKLREEVRELRSMLKAFVQRSYKMYPVDCPSNLRIDNKLAPVISFEDAQAKLNKNEVERCVMDPLLQAYAGSNRGNNRLVTLFSKDGNIYHVRAEYDPKENKINPPK
jgi:hypothetical protein